MTETQLSREVGGTGTGDASRTARLYALDVLRAVIAFIVVAFHSSESFEPGAEGWAILDRSASPLLSVIRHALASWAMEAMFLTAGFAAAVVVQRRGITAFARDRLGRIGVTLAIAWLILYPIAVALWLVGAAKTGNLGKVGIPPELQHLPLWQLWLGFFIKLQFIPAFNLLHLWFLHQLLVIYAVVVGARALWRRLDATGAARGWLDRRFAGLFASPWCVLAMAALTTPILGTMANAWKGLVVTSPAYSLVPYVPTTLLYGLMFVVGWMLQRRPEALAPLARRWWAHLALALALVMPTRVLGLDPDPRYHEVHLALYALMMWGFVLGITGACVRFFTGPSARWRYYADASYWIYLAHWPVVVVVQILVADIDVPWPPKLLFINAVVFPVMFLSYRYLVRGTFVGQQINGRRH